MQDYTNQLRITIGPRRYVVIRAFETQIPPKGQTQTSVVLELNDLGTRTREIHHGVAMLSPVDEAAGRYDMYEGIRYAARRAMDTAGLSREERAAVRKGLYENRREEQRAQARERFSGVDQLTEALRLKSARFIADSVIKPTFVESEWGTHLVEILRALYGSPRS